MTAINTLGVENLSLRGTGDEYNRFSRFFRTRAEAEAALASGDWTPVAGVANACLTADEGVLTYDQATNTLVNADDATREYINTQITNLVGDAPAVLDQLGELSDALGDDANFITTINDRITSEANRVDSLVATDMWLFSDQSAFPDASSNHGRVVHSHADGAMFYAHAGMWHKIESEADSDAADAALSGRLDTLEADPTTATAVAAVQADVDQNEADSDAADAALSARLDTLEADPTTATAVAAVQADVDQNEADADAADAALSGRLDVLEADPTTATAVAAVQSDVDQNEADADAADAALSGRLDVLEADPVTKAYVDGTTTTEALARQAQDDILQNNIDAVQADVDQNEADSDAADAALSARLDTLEVDPTTAAAVAAVQADVDQNEADADAAIAVERGRIDAILDSAAVDTDSFAEVVALINSIDTENDNVFAGYVTSNNAALATERARIDAVETEIDTARTNIYTALGQAEGATTMGTFTGSTLGDGQTIKQLLQTLETASETEISDRQAAIADILDGATFTGDIFLGDLARLQRSGNELKIRNDGESSSIVLGPKISLQPATGSRIELFETVRMPDGTDLTVTGAELNFVDGVTSNIQTQLDAIQADVDQNESDADAAIAAVQADVDQNEADSDAADAALSGRLDTLEADPTTATAVAAVQADVDQNEADADAAIAVERARIDAILSGAGADTDTFAEVVALVNSVDTENDSAFAGYVTSNDAALATERARIDAVETEIDTARTNIYTAIGQAESSTEMGTFTGSTLGDGQTIKQLLQTLETATEGEISARTAIAEFASNLTRLKNDLRGTYINVGNNIELRPAPGGRVEIVGDLYLDNNTAIDGNGTILTSFANINAYDGRLNALEADPTTATAVAAVQADVDQNEADADAAIAAVQADVDQNEADADAAIAAVQADVDQNEADADAAIALKADIASPTFTGTPAAPTASAGTNTTQLATTAFVSTAVANLVDGAPGAIDTLNELAAALGDDANFSTTVTNSIAAVQADVDQNEVDSDAADAALSGRLDVLEADPTTATAVAAVQADVDQNEADADAAIAAVQADVDQNEADADAAIAAVQADVDQNEIDSDAADAALSGRLDVLEADATTATAVAAVQADVDQNEADADAAIAAVQADVDQNEADADAAIAANEVHIDNLVTLTGVSKDSTNLGTFSGTTISDSRTLKLALQDLETALENKANISFVQNEIADVIDGAPGALNTLNEIAAAMGDDENLSVTLTNLINANEAHVDNMATLTGVAKDSTHLATFTGSTINDNQTIKQALQALETQVEATQADVDQNESDADAAIAAVQADVDQNEIDGDAADAALSGRLDTLEADPTTATAVAAVQADVDQNEADADAADAALSGRLDVLEADPTTATAVAAVQADVDQNEADADAAIALKLDASAVSAFGLTLVDDADAAAARTTLGVDAAGTDNSTDVTIAVGRDYISISGQELTLGAVDLAADVTGTLPVANGGTGATDVAGVKAAFDIDHIHTTIGVAANADDLGTFTGTTIDDNVTIKAALQALETAQETTQADVDQNESDADAAIANILNGTSIPGPYNNDIDAAAGGVAVGAIFKNSNGTIHWRVS